VRLKGRERTDDIKGREKMNERYFKKETDLRKTGSTPGRPIESLREKDENASVIGGLDKETGHRTKYGPISPPKAKLND